MVGDWKLGVVVRRTGQLDVSATFDLPVQQPLPPQRVPPPDDGIRVPAPVAALWLVLPDGTAGWLVLVAVLLVVVILAAIDRQRQGAGRRRVRWSTPLRLGLLAILLVAGLGVGSRAIIQAANQPTGAIASQSDQGGP